MKSLRDSITKSALIWNISSDDQRSSLCDRCIKMSCQNKMIVLNESIGYKSLCASKDTCNGNSKSDSHNKRTNSNEFGLRKQRQERQSKTKSVIIKSANGPFRMTSKCLVKSVILSVFWVLILQSSFVSADPELLQRQYSSSVYSSHVSQEDSVNNNDNNNDQQSQLRKSVYRSRSSSTLCQVDCKTSKLREFCASDGKTYSSKCEIRKVNKCEGKDIEFVSKGPCQGQRQDSPSGRLANCLQQVQKMERENPNDDIYKPSCNSDGTYKTVQCFAGFCWCMTSEGVNIPATSVEGARPNCSKGAVKSTKCTKSDRTQFNVKLVRSFSTAYARSPEAQIQYENGEEEQLGIIEWKFKELDKYQDGILDSREMKTLNRLVRNQIKPKKCAKRFPNYCDGNKDGQITEEEWSSCLDDKTSSSRPKTPRPDQPNSPSERNDAVGDNNPMPSKDTFPILSVPGNHKNPAEEPTNGKDCHDERAEAEENERNAPNGQMYVPECVEGGLYRKEQCHKQAGYCWCVDEKTGVPIPDTSTTNTTPDCSNAKRARTIKDCVNAQKRFFMTQVLDTLSNEMVTFAEQNPSDMSKISMDPQLSLEERAVRWKFAMLDSNSNDELSRKEMKNVKNMFTSTIAGQPTLRKCARNFLRYCDENGDAKVTTGEWVSCLKLEETPSNGNNNPRSPAGRQNPLTQYLIGS